MMVSKAHKFIDDSWQFGAVAVYEGGIYSDVIFAFDHVKSKKLLVFTSDRELPYEYSTNDDVFWKPLS